MESNWTGHFPFSKRAWNEIAATQNKQTLMFTRNAGKCLHIVVPLIYIYIHSDICFCRGFGCWQFVQTTETRPTHITNMRNHQDSGPWQIFETTTWSSPEFTCTSPISWTNSWWCLPQALVDKVGTLPNHTSSRDNLSAADLSDAWRLPRGSFVQSTEFGLVNPMFVVETSWHNLVLPCQIKWWISTIYHTS